MLTAASEETKKASLLQPAFFLYSRMLIPLKLFVAQKNFFTNFFPIHTVALPRFQCFFFFQIEQSDPEMNDLIAITAHIN
jgi:hypothetical protein